MIRRFAILIMLFSFSLALFPAEVWARKLPPADFNEMYSVASSGNLGSLLAASSRGLNLDAVNRNGDAGICVAIKRRDFLAYNTFIKAGAMVHHPCVNMLSKQQYQSFMSSSNAIKYSDYPTSFKPRENHDWVIAGAFVLFTAGMVWLVQNATSN